MTAMMHPDTGPEPRSGTRNKTAAEQLPEGGIQPAASLQGVTPHAIELRHLRYFVAVADAGTFTHAAERMFIAQPTLSQQIRRLEELVGAPLLQRGREGVRLTDAGTVLLEESRILLSLVEHGMSRTRQAAGLGRSRVRVAICPGMPPGLAAATASRLKGTAADAGVDVTWLDTSLDTEFTLIRQHQADAALGWLALAGQPLLTPLDVMNLGDFEPEAWIPSAHPAARRHTITLAELSCLDVVHGPRRASTGTYDAWRAILQTANPHFEFTDPPFRQSPRITLAFAATATRPTAVLSSPRYPIGTPITTRRDQASNNYNMAAVRLAQSPLTASAALVWNSDLPGPLQQILFHTADSIAL